jgi:hypothetical protein
MERKSCINSELGALHIYSQVLRQIRQGSLSDTILTNPYSSLTLNCAKAMVAGTTNSCELIEKETFVFGKKSVNQRTLQIRRQSERSTVLPKMESSFL